MQIRTNQSYSGKAEGDCHGLPYNTDLVNINGVNIHFWVKQDLVCPRGMLPPLMLANAFRVAQGHRDIVSASYSIGEPDGYWAHADIG